MIKGIIFDLDGVLVSTDELHYQAWKQLAENYGIHEFNRQDNERQRGVSRMASLEVVLEKSNRTYSLEEKEKMATEKNDTYKGLLASLGEEAILPGVVDSLKRLKERGVKMAVGSASKNAPAILAQTGLIHYMDAVSCGLDTTRSKPDPEVFLIAAQKLGLEPKVCLVVEDSKAGVEAAHRGHMKALSVGPFYKALGGDLMAPTIDVDWETIILAED